MKKKKSSVKEKLKYAGIFILVIAICVYLYYSSPVFADILKLDSIVNSAETLFPKLIILVLFFLIFKMVSVFIVDYAVGRFMEAFHTRSRITSIKNVINFFLWALYVLIALPILTGDFGSFVSSLGLVGLGLTFALQKPILNFVGWITISLKDIYNQNDRIRIGNVVGDVKEIQMMNTILYSLVEGSDARSHKIITIPNELVLTQEVENFTKDSNYILTKLSISITYESDVEKSMEILRGIVKNYLKENINDYKKWEKRRGSLKKVLESFLVKSPTKPSVELSPKEKELDVLKNEFIPRMRLELNDSSVDLKALFLVPYEKSKIAKTIIAKEFLEKSKKHKNIAMAYPHLEVIHHKEKKRV